MLTKGRIKIYTVDQLSLPLITLLRNKVDIRPREGRSIYRQRAYGVDRGSSWREAIAAGEKAIALDPDLVEAYPPLFGKPELGADRLDLYVSLTGEASASDRAEQTLSSRS